MRQFQEYLNAKGVMKEKGDVAILAKNLEVKPGGPIGIPKERKPMKHGKQAQIKEGKKGKKAEHGFGDLGNKKLIYDAKGVKPAKLPTAEAYQWLPVIRESIAQDPTMVEALVREFKRNGMLGILVGELSQHKETFSHLTELMGHGEYGPSICKKLARALKENVAMPFSRNDEEEDDLEDEDEDEEDLGDDEDDEMAPPPGMDGQDPNAMGDEMGGDDMDMMGGEDPNAMGDEMGGEDPTAMGGEMPPPGGQIHHHHNPVHIHHHHHGESPAMENFRQAMKLV